jgi:hypothetical protein
VKGTDGVSEERFVSPWFDAHMGPLKKFPPKVIEDPIEKRAEQLREPDNIMSDWVFYDWDPERDQKEERPPAGDRSP